MNLEEMRQELIFGLVLEKFKTEDEEATKMIDQTIAFVKNYGKFQQQGFTIQFANVAQ